MNSYPCDQGEYDDFPETPVQSESPGRMGKDRAQAMIRQYNAVTTGTGARVCAAALRGTDPPRRCHQPPGLGVTVETATQRSIEKCIVRKRFGIFRMCFFTARPQVPRGDGSVVAWNETLLDEWRTRAGGVTFDAKTGVNAPAVSSAVDGKQVGSGGDRRQLDLELLPRRRVVDIGLAD